MIDLDTPEGLQEAIKWQTNFISILGEGGKWAVPRSNAIYTIYHSKKLALRETPDEAVDYIFNKMGWTVQEGKNDE